MRNLTGLILLCTVLFPVFSGCVDTDPDRNPLDPNAPAGVLLQQALLTSGGLNGSGSTPLAGCASANVSVTLSYSDSVDRTVTQFNAYRYKILLTAARTMNYTINATSNPRDYDIKFYDGDCTWLTGGNWITSVTTTPYANTFTSSAHAYYTLDVRNNSATTLTFRLTAN